MKRLNDFVNEASTNQPSLIDYDSNDSGLMKLIKGVLRWANGSTEDPAYNPSHKDYDIDKFEAAKKEWKHDSGTKYAEMDIKELKEEEFKKLLQEYKKSLKNFKKDIADNKKLYENNTYKAILITMKGICKKLPVAFYSFNKSLHRKKYLYIVNIESASPKYEDIISSREIMKEIAKDMKSINASAIKIRFSNDECFESLMDDLKKSSNFERDRDSENGSEIIYVSKTVKKQEKTKKTNEDA